MAVYRYDKELGKMVLISKKAFRRSEHRELPLAEQVMRGYRRQEEKGARINGRAEGIKRIWGGN